MSMKAAFSIDKKERMFLDGDKGGFILSNTPIKYFINPEVKVENNAVEELHRLLEVNETIATLQKHSPDYFDDPDAGVLEVAITPDFHKGSGIPVGTTLFTRGFVLPQAIGNDINCGMRLYVTDLCEEQIRTHLDAIERNVRHVFFRRGPQYSHDAADA
ncbi:RtcB family protein [Brevibacillus brevis]|uniref:RtcB family protein n=1 Tax=Brevibacillus brevis TaxID=1393 RepID=UPI00211B1582|nr:RtcB family protein [Brevibacillus brevis]